MNGEEEHYIGQESKMKRIVENMYLYFPTFNDVSLCKEEYKRALVSHGAANVKKNRK